MPNALERDASRAAEDPFYIRALSSRVDIRTRVLKQGDTFAVFDRYGDVFQLGVGELGLYHEGTRFLSHLEFRLSDERPLLLSSTVSRDNLLVAVDLANPDLTVSDQDARIVVPRGTLHFSRTKLLWQGVCHERLRVTNFGPEPVRVAFSYDFGADFVDIFEVRGIARERRGRILEPLVDACSVVLAYEGLDGVLRRTTLSCRPAPDRMSPREAWWRPVLEPRQELVFELAAACETAPESAAVAPCARMAAVAHSARAVSYDAALESARTERAGFELDLPRIRASNEQMGEWIEQSLADLHLMITRTPEGPYPYAGVPWFSTIFGRDGIVTALECLWFHPELAEGVLSCLAATQAREEDRARDAQPGKILHETRHGEMAGLGEIPFGLYYGSVDSTPLFVMLAGEYFRRTADLEFVASIWPGVDLALRWIETYGDPDGDGFVEYARSSADGLVQQGWKDSWDSVFHEDGTLADAPIALCEVQGYAFRARRLGAELARALGHAARAEELEAAAERLEPRFREAFWDERLGTFALALDSRKRPCRVRTSNAGHCLWTGIASAEQAARVADTLFEDGSFCGWGVRTVDAREARYNPMSYHNGSVWPHDNAIVAAGLARYGFKARALRILDGLFHVALNVDLHRLPELFCGFERRPSEGPTLYPVACAPQAWASGAVFMLLQACLGISVRVGREEPATGEPATGEPAAGAAQPPSGERREPVRSDARSRIVLSRPLLPESLPRLRISDLRVGDASVDLLLERHDGDVGINILRRTGDVEVVAVK